MATERRHRERTEPAAHDLVADFDARVLADQEVADRWGRALPSGRLT